MKHPPLHDGPATRGPDPTPVADDLPGLPWLHRWRTVYLFVLGCFALWVALLVVFGWLFA